MFCNVVYVYVRHMKGSMAAVDGNFHGLVKT